MQTKKKERTVIIMLSTELNSADIDGIVKYVLTRLTRKSLSIRQTANTIVVLVTEIL